MDRDDNTLINELRQRVEAGRMAFISAAIEMRKHYAVIREVQRDTQVYMAALGAATRGSEHPYEPTMLPEISFSFQDHNNEILPPEVAEDADENEAPRPEATSELFNLSQPPTKSKRQRKGGKALDLSNNSVTGVLRNILRAAVGPVTIDQMLKSVPSDLSITVDREAIYRVLPKMQKRQEIIPTGKRGEYRYNAEKFR